MESTIVYWGYIGVLSQVMESNMESTILYRDYIGIICG